MILRRLTKIQKDEILEEFRGGENTNTLATKYNCSPNTINRTVKKLLSDFEYKNLKEKRLNSNNKKVASSTNKNSNSKQEDLDQVNSFNSSQAKSQEEEQTKKIIDDSNCSDYEEVTFLPVEELNFLKQKNHKNSDIDEVNHDYANEFEEIAPLVSGFDFEKKEFDFEILGQENLPESVYLVVDKKVELEVKSISELEEWSFLSEDELKRKAILLFSNQRTAKRSCSKNQRVIKIPNTSVFEISKSYLISKGITRLILEDSIIALDN